MRGNPHDGSDRGPSYTGTERPGQVYRSREAALGSNHGRTPEKNARPLPYLPYGHSTRTPTQTQQGITLTDRRNLMMLESPVRGKRARRVWREPVRKRSSNATFAGWLPYGEAIAIIAGVRQTVQVFVMWLSHSRRRFVMAFPSQKQESFFYGHTCAFAHFGGVPWRISYDNLSTAVQVMVRGKGRRENQMFVSFRSYYLFESHFCQPAAGWEKGGVEASVGFSRRNFMVPIPDVASFEELNLHLLTSCLKDDQRRVSRQLSTIGQMWEHERPLLRSLPPFAYDCCATTSARLNGYSLVTYETNRYSVPVNRARRDVIVKAYPFHLEILDGTTLLARHPRCYAREQDLFEPLHYLSLLEMRPGAFDYARPLKKWQAGWPESYHRMLRGLRERWPEGGRGIQEFIRVLRLHEDYPAPLVQQAIEQALAYGCPHLDGVLHCLHQLSSCEDAPTSLQLAEPSPLQAVGTQPIDLRQYEQLLRSSG